MAECGCVLRVRYDADPCVCTGAQILKSTEVLVLCVDRLMDLYLYFFGFVHVYIFSMALVYCFKRCLRTWLCTHIPLTTVHSTGCWLQVHTIKYPNNPHSWHVVTMTAGFQWSALWNHIGVDPRWYHQCDSVMCMQKLLCIKATTPPPHTVSAGVNPCVHSVFSPGWMSRLSPARSWGKKDNQIIWQTESRCGGGGWGG